MKKKLFTLLTLFVLCVTGASANSEEFDFTGYYKADINAIVNAGSLTTADGLVTIMFSNPGTDFQGDGNTSGTPNGSIKMRGASERNATLTFKGSPLATISQVVITWSANKRTLTSVPSVEVVDDNPNKTLTFNYLNVGNVAISQNVGNMSITKIAVTYSPTNISCGYGIWDFKNGNPTSLDPNAVNIQGSTKDIVSSNASISMHVDATSGKLNYRTANGDAQFNNGAKLQIPVNGTKDEVSVTIRSNTGIKIGDNTVTGTGLKTYTATAEDVAQGYVEIKATADNNYLYSISVSQYYVSLSPTKDYTTLCSTEALDFTDITDIEAYYVSATDGSSASLAKINKVPANQGLIIKKINNGTVNVPVIETADAISNKLTGVTSPTTLVTGDYILSNGSFVKVDLTGDAESKKLPAFKAYLGAGNVLGAHVLSLDFGDVTVIKAVDVKKVENNVFFNLAGQQVAQPTKGLYIVNGKKVIIK